jgi:predicted PurR-regulated permease PerM
LIGITFFGNLWGIFGVVAGVPITALLYATLSRLINISLYRRGIYVTREHIAKTDEDGNKTSNLI